MLTRAQGHAYVTNMQLLALEGDMRYALVRVRESAESIAFYGGEKAEARMVSFIA